MAGERYMNSLRKIAFFLMLLTVPSNELESSNSESTFAIQHGSLIMQTKGVSVIKDQHTKL